MSNKRVKNDQTNDVFDVKTPHAKQGASTRDEQLKFIAEMKSPEDLNAALTLIHKRLAELSDTTRQGADKSKRCRRETNSSCDAQGNNFQEHCNEVYSFHERPRQRTGSVFSHLGSKDSRLCESYASSQPVDKQGGQVLPAYIPDTPLAPMVVYAPVQSKINVNINPVGQYNGETNPMTHLLKLSDYMNYLGATDATKCKMFPLTLDNRAFQSRQVLPIPLAPIVVDAPIQHKINVNVDFVGQYNGQTNPVTHLSKFSTNMLASGATDATKCRLFSMTLDDRAFNWYLSLAHGSVSSFHQLGQLFLEQFAFKIPHKAGIERMFFIKQWEDETDRAYLERVNDIIIDGTPVPDEVKVAVAVNGLKLGSKLWKSMIKNFPSSYAEFTQRADEIVYFAELLAQRYLAN